MAWLLSRLLALLVKRMEIDDGIGGDEQQEVDGLLMILLKTVDILVVYRKRFLDRLLSWVL